MIACPLLTLDLMWTLNLPYKFTYTLFVFLVLFSGFISSGHPDPGRWMWFAYGMTIFAFTWLRIVGLVQVRFLQYFAKKEKAPAGASQDNRRQSISAKAGFRQKEVRNPLQFALYVYFTIWMIYPLLWVLAAEGLITSVVNHCVTVMMDVLAKSMYGFALLEFQLRIDKSQVEFTQLKVTKAALQTATTRGSSPQPFAVFCFVLFPRLTCVKCACACESTARCLPRSVALLLSPPQTSFAKRPPLALKPTRRR